MSVVKKYRAVFRQQCKVIFRISLFTCEMNMDNPALTIPTYLRNIRTVLRIALILICTLSFLVGISLGSVGIGILANKDKLRGMINLVDVGEMEILEKYKEDVGELIDKYDAISNIGLSFIVLGLMVSIVSFLGLVGTCMLSKIILTVYSGVMSILLISVLGITVYCAVFRSRISESMLERLIKLQDKHFISVIGLLKSKDSINATITLAINYMHFSLRCCGMKNVGDCRDSKSWLGSERRIMQLMEIGVDLFNDGGKSKSKKKAKSDQAIAGTAPNEAGSRQSRAMSDYTLFEYSGTSSTNQQPDWMRYDVPAELTLPTDLAIPNTLPEGFEIDEKAFDEISEIVEEVVEETVKAVTEVLDEVLVMSTPLTCCKMENIKKLLTNEFDANFMYESMQEISCVFEKENYGVNDLTCYDALWDYLQQYVTPVLALAGLLIFLLAITVALSIGIILLNY